MTLPTQFQIMGKTIKIVEDETLDVTTDNVAEYHSRFDKIVIQKNSLACPRNDDQIGEALWHEITHTILDYTGEEGLNKNEKFVGLFGGLLYQVYKTLK